MQIAINCDMGEGYGRWDMGSDEQVMPYITAANIACGFHAGDPSRIARTVRLAAAHGVGIGAHPSYPDLQGFGRRAMHMSPDEVRDMVTYQIGALAAFARACGARLEHVKPHGALYNRCAEDETTARAVIEAARQVDPSLVIVVLAGSAFEKAAKNMGYPYAREVFADRGYDAAGRLVPRGLPGAVLTDADVIAERVWLMVREGRVQAVTGEWLHVRADTVCIHGDAAGVIDIARRIHTTLTARGVNLLTLSRLIARRTGSAAK